MGDLAQLRDHLRSLERVVVAFSGGADSALLAWVAHDTLGPERAIAVTAVSPSLASDEHADCAELATAWGLSWVEVLTDEMHAAAYRRNDGDRCFWCKDALMDAVTPMVADDGEHAGATVVLGVNESAVVVPMSAIVKEGPLQYVFVKEGKGENEVFKKRDVATGVRDDRVVEIKQGLVPGDVIVVSGAFSVSQLRGFVPGAPESAEPAPASSKSGDGHGHTH